MKHTKRCRGERVSSRPVLVTQGVSSVERLLLWCECATCGTWLSLGPSDEAPVAVEVRAARIAASVSGRRGPNALPYDEWSGWFNTDGLGAVSAERYHAGHLARVIHDHDQTEPRHG